jgi:hypothetical protein
MIALKTIATLGGNVGTSEVLLKLPKTICFGR